MHSRYKLEVFYSQLNATMIEKFYGNYDEINGFKKQEILNLIKLNVRLKAKVLFLPKYHLSKKLDMLRTPDWEEFNKLNISELFRLTSPRYFVPHCRLNSIDCRHNWRLRRRIMDWSLFKF